MSNLFGIDIAGIVAKEIASAGGVQAGVLTKVTPGTRTSGRLTDGTNPTTAAHAFRGFLENKSEERIPGGLPTIGGDTLSILGATLPAGVVPEVNDKVTLDGVGYLLVELLRRDPAAALFKFRVQS